MDVLETINKFEDQSLDTLKQAQDAILDATRSIVDAVAPLVPKVGALPYTEQLPEPSELVANAFDFAGKLLEAGREFSTELLAAVAPLAAAQDDSASTVTTTAKPAAPKAKVTAAA